MTVLPHVPLMSYWITLWLLLAAHVLCDYPLQGDFLAQMKNRHTTVGRDLWVIGLPSHCLIHATAVLLITGVWWLGLMEFFLHTWIDWLKCENKISFKQDQFFHALCKVAYVGLLFAL